MAETRPPTIYTVPIGTPTRACYSKTCTVTVYLIDSPKNPGKKIPIDCTVDGGRVPTATEHGLGVNHFTTCTEPHKFHAKRPPARSATTLTKAPSGPHCLFCGCSDAVPCFYPPDDYEMEQAGADTGAIACYWVQNEPPICSAPSCREKRKDLPLRMKMASHSAQGAKP